MPLMGTTRRVVLGGLAGSAALGASWRARAAAVPALPTSPITLSIIDVAGNLQLTRPAFQDFAKENPSLVAGINFTQATAPELPGKLKAQQAAGRVDIDMVLTGTDALAAGIAQDLWQRLFPYFAGDLPKLQDVLLPAALNMQELAQDQGVCVSYCPGGPLLEYIPDLVKTPPKTAQELLDWARANKGQFIYARPANSGPGRAFLMGVPYILGDADPMDPENGWPKTWAYLRELGKNIAYYPTGTGAVMKELGEGSRAMTVTMTGWDINPRALGVVPKEAQVSTIEGFHFVTDAHYMCVPRGVAPGHLAVLLKLMAYMLTPKAQAYAWDKGYFYPGPAVKDVPLSMAPAEDQAVIKEYDRPIYASLIANTPKNVPLPAQKMVYAFQRWDEQIGANVGK
ncbi:MAG TPA: extracellular solute-binding protein [Acetobacteraceae bacterium]|nr:extracellular solute-binding protein [Acetobacteraceae bacterium]